MNHKFRNSVLQGAGSSLLSFTFALQFTNAERALQAALFVGAIWFGVSLLVLGSEEPLQYAAKQYAEYRNSKDLEEKNRIINSLMREIELRNKEIDDLMNEGTPTDKNAVAALARRLIEDYFRYEFSMGYAAVNQRKACSRADWDHVHKLFVEAGIKSNSGSVIAKSEEEAWAKFLRTWNESKVWVKTRNGDLVKGVRSTI